MIEVIIVEVETQENKKGCQGKRQIRAYMAKLWDTLTFRVYKPGKEIS